VVNAFGTNRLMIGSDWPVCTLAGKYGEVIGMALDYIGQFSVGEREMILGVNAVRVYSLLC
jgi:L-fuconolactonase